MRYLTFLLLWMVIMKHVKCDDMSDVMSDDMSDELLLDDIMSGDDISLSTNQDLIKLEDFTTRSISFSTLARSSTTPGPNSDFQTSPYDLLKKGPTNEPVIRVSSFEFELCLQGIFTVKENFLFGFPRGIITLRNFASKVNE